MALALSEPTLVRIQMMFSDNECQAVIDLLRNECGNNLPFFEKASPQSSERIRFAVLKLSGGSMPELLKAVRIAKEDWRDVLVAAGFGNEVTIHESWWPDKNGV